MEKSAVVDSDTGKSKDSDVSWVEGHDIYTFPLFLAPHTSPLQIQKYHL